MYFLSLLSPILVLLIANALSQETENCDNAPTPAMKEYCLKLRAMAAHSRATFQKENDAGTWKPANIPAFLRPIAVQPGSRGQVASNPLDCMTLTCLCPYVKGKISGTQCILPSGQPMKMAYRKEYRMLSEEERNRFHRAITILKRSGEYDRLGRIHRAVGSGSGAHSGPGFLPWHREFMKRFEVALRLIDPEVSVPYWDSVVDHYLPDPRDSILFSDIFAGNTDIRGNVVTGPYAFWVAMNGYPTIIRNPGAEGALFTENNINNVLAQNNIEYIMAYTAPMAGCPIPLNYNALEYTHANVHIWIGGHMKPPETSSNDPLFFMHHAFVDMIWEMWRQRKQSRAAREIEYSPNLPTCADPQHFSYAPMRPWFHLANRDGLSNMYTDQMYKFASRPHCSTSNPSCDSPYLFCDARTIAHCVAKVKLNGLCVGFEGLDVCFNGVCVGGRCRPGPTQFRPQTRMSAAPMPKPTAVAKIFTDCYNRHPCCDMWGSVGQCRKNAPYMNQFCPVTCAQCTPNFNKTDVCTDRHVSCKQWQTDGQCTGSSNQFMEENCRQSCNLCSVDKRVGCPMPPV